MDLPDIAAAVVLAAAAVTAAGYLVKRLRGGFRLVDQLEQLVQMTEDIKRLVNQELTHNTGSSMKDDVHGLAISVHRAHNRIDDVHNVLRTFAEANHLVFPLIETAIRATPPEERDDAPNT